jgi:hypothetical protein
MYLIKEGDFVVTKRIKIDKQSFNQQGPSSSYLDPHTFL